MPESTSKSMCAWIAPGQIQLLDAMRTQLGISIEAVGCDGRSGESADAAKALGAESCSTFRELAHRSQGRMMFLGAVPHDVSDGMPQMLQHAARVFTLEPIPDSIYAQSLETNQDAPSNVHFLPLFRNSSGFQAALEAIGTSTAPRVVSLTSTTPPHCGSLGARLLDAMDAVLTLLGEPEMIDASIHGPGHSGVQVEPGKSLRSSHGELTAHIRCADGGTATITLSDRAGRWVQDLTALGDAGAMCISEQQFTWTDTDGTVIEQAHTSIPPLEPGFSRSVIETIQRILDIHAPASRPIDMRRTLAVCEAAILSARTGQPESPATVLQMIGAG